MNQIEQDRKIVLDSYDMQTMVTNKDFNETFILEYPKFFDEDFCKKIIEKYHFLHEQGLSEISDAGEPGPRGQWSRAKGEHIWMNHIEALNLTHAAHVTGECKHTLPEGEGETEFLNQGVRCKPEVGKLLIWPAQWTHTHRGNPNYSTDKYVLTGWIHTNDQTLDYRMEE